MTDIEKSLLIHLLEITPANDSGVDSLAFRAKYFESIKLIDQLEAVGYIRKDQERYFVSLTGLVQLDVERSIRILDDAEKLFHQLKIHYARSQREGLKIDDVARRAGVDDRAAREALSYMVEGTWWGGRSGSFFTTPDAQIQPSESILGFESFAAVVQQLRSWQAARMRDRQKALAAALRVHVDKSAQPFLAVLNTERQRPDWFAELPERIRDLLGETYSAISLDLRALPAMGARALIDVVAVELVGDAGSFEKKLTLLQEGGHITATSKSILSVAIDVGNASAHRGYVPGRDDLGILLDVVEHLLQAHYILPQAAEKMKANTPARPHSKKQKA